jgi:hypothetical protein
MQLRKKKKKSAQQDLDRTGSHLSRGTIGRTKTPAIDDASADAEADQSGTSALELGNAAPKSKKKTKKKMKPVADGDMQLPDADQTAAAPAVSGALPSATKKPAKEREKSKLSEKTTTEQVAEGNAFIPVRTKEGHNNMNGKARPPTTKANGKAVAGRVHSESPARSARFASSTDQLVVRHEPPPRSLSPRKSAMKHSSPTRAVSPSDDGSEASTAALGHSLKDDAARKKSARVSWDDRHTVVVSEPPQQQQESNAAGSPSPQSKKPWLNSVGKNSKKETSSAETEETMSPRPALPSFGSVREKKPKDQEERPLVRPQEHAISPLPSADPQQTMAEPAGEIAPQDADPIVPVLPSIEGDDDVSSSDGSLMDDTTDDDAEAAKDDTDGSYATVPAAESTDSSHDTAGEEVPTISVSQASTRQPEYDAQSGDIDGDNVPHPGTADAAPSSDELSSGSDEADSEDMATLPSGPHMDDIVEEEEEEEPDMYSDAYEDVSEMEGHGFMSLDAVLELESPTASPKAKKSVDETPTEPKATTIEANAAEDEAAPPADDWENAKAYWRSLSIDKRRQLEEEAEAEAEASHESSKTKSHGKVKELDSAVSTPEKTVTKNGRVYQIQPGSTLAHEALSGAVTAATDTGHASPSTHHRQSLEKEHNHVPAQSQPVSSMRKSMRSERPMSSGSVEGIMERRGDGQSASVPTSGSRMKKSLRQKNSTDVDMPERRPSVASVGRPASYHPAMTETGGKVHKRNRSVDAALSSTVTSPASGMKSTLRRRGSDSSESSFTRMRSPPTGARGFRKSMRGNTPDVPATADGTSSTNRFSLRPGSPAELNARRNSVSSLPAGSGGGMGRMRQSLRSESVDRHSRKRMPTFTKSPNNKGKKAKGRSRFGDSSDEDDEPFSTFRSRFADSSSDEDERPASKGRGMPKSLRSKTNQRANATAVDLRSHRRGFDSPDLSEQENGIAQPPGSQVGGTGQLQRNRSGRGTLLPIPAAPFADEAGEGSDRPRPRRGSFMSILRRKKDSSAKVTRPGMTESAARRDTPLERTANELETVRGNNGHQSVPSWPLPEPGAQNDSAGAAGSIEIDRPSTAGGPIRSDASKTKFLRRRSASQGTTPVGPDPFANATSPQKKKKFGALRKMFGLND